MVQPAYEKDLFPHWFTMSVRFRDLDPLNHVNNAIFSTYYEQARVHFTNNIPALAGGFEKGFSFVVVNLQIDFIKPATFPSNLLIGSGIKNKGNTSMTGFQAIYHKESKQLISVAETSGVWYNLKRQKPARLPEIDNPETLFINEKLI